MILPFSPVRLIYLLQNDASNCLWISPTLGARIMVLNSLSQKLCRCISLAFQHHVLTFVIALSDMWLRRSYWVWCRIQSCIGLHIRELCTRYLQTLQPLTCLSCTTLGADCTILLSVYRWLIHLSLNYGCQIYGSATATYFKTLLIIQQRDLRLAIGTFRSSPVLSLYK